MKIITMVIFISITLFSCNQKATDSPVDYTQFVNPFIGTDGTGHTFPGACAPFGLVQPSPDNKDHDWNYASGYQYSDSVILGFSNTHANGTGINELGDVLLLPFIEEKKDSFSETYFKNSEKASPGLYTVTLKNNVKAELTASPRVAFHRYTFPLQQNVKVFVDLQHGLRFLTDSLVLESAVNMENDSTISGYCHTKNWVDRKYFFLLKFDQPFSKSVQLPEKRFQNAPRYVLTFDLKEGKILQAKVALSTVSIEGARNNMMTEVPGWNFESVHQQTKMSWNSYLPRIDIDADKRQKEIFYTCMYRLFIQPSNIADVDGRYRGNDDSVRTAANKQYFSTLSNWDIYRAAFPLYNIIAPEIVDGIINSMLAHEKTAGYLPVWTIWGKENNCMIGNHSIPMITCAYINGFRGFDVNEALDAMIQTTTVNHVNSDWKIYNHFGYYPFDQLDNESVSRTLESCVDDYSVAVLADSLGRKEVADVYYKRAGYYINLFDPETKLMRGKDSNGKWRTPFDPLKPTSPMNNPGDYTEANAWQYFWTPAQFDIEKMTQLLGGKHALTLKLDSFFSIETGHADKFLGQEAMLGQYAHGNEPSHHVAYLYAFSDHPKRCTEIITAICNQFYNNTPDGMIGNDDCGQMSAWYIFSTLGFYPVNPATGEYVVGIPQVKKAIVHTLGNQQLLIKSGNVTGTEKIILNGVQISKPSISHKSLIRKEATLIF